MFLSPRVFAISRHSHLLCLKPSPSLISMENSTGVSEQQVEFLRATVSFVLGCPPGWEGLSRAKSCLWTHPGPARAGRCPHGGSHPGFLQDPKGAEGTAGETKLTCQVEGAGTGDSGGDADAELADGGDACPKATGRKGFLSPSSSVSAVRGARSGLPWGDARGHCHHLGWRPERRRPRGLGQFRGD